MNELSSFADFIERRKDFPSLERTHNGYPLAYLDGPGGTQVPRQVIDAVSWYYKTCNSNTHGFFITTNESDAMIEETRHKLAAFLGAGSGKNISFGHNMTTLNYMLSRALGKHFQPGDEILITQLDHEANRGPWIALREEGIIVQEVRIKDDATLDYEDMESKLNENTRLVAMGFSANTTGTVNNVRRARQMAYQVGAWLLVDAVHYAPHFPIDASSLGVDFLLCSAYKFYGTHLGILYSREGLLDSIPAYRLRTQEQYAPYCIETGTLNHAAISGAGAAVDYIATFGKGENLREKIVQAMERLARYEHILAKRIFEGLQEIPGVTVIGPSFATNERAPTVSFTIEGKDPVEVCKRLNEKGICAWDGHFYGIRPIEVLGLLERGGVTRVGISLYNTEEEVVRLLDVVREIAQ